MLREAPTPAPSLSSLDGEMARAYLVEQRLQTDDLACQHERASIYLGKVHWVTWGISLAIWAVLVGILGGPDEKTVEARWAGTVLGTINLLAAAILEKAELRTRAEKHRMAAMSYTKVSRRLAMAAMRTIKETVVNEISEDLALVDQEAPRLLLSHSVSISRVSMPAVNVEEHTEV